jgi:hypothetical protein
MANQEHLDILKQGVEAWNAWRMKNPKIEPDLDGADLKGANLTGAILAHACLISANLFRVNLTGAYLYDADLTRADLTFADLTRADLTRASLYGANLCHANLRGAQLWRTVFGDIDLSEVHGLASIWHEGPSIVGIDTIYRSGGKIPESFLRGAGIPENFITYMRSLTDAALDFCSVFISYSTANQAFADRLYADLQARGVRCWFAPHDIQGGRKLHEQIDEAIKIYDKLLLILSDASMSSNWVKTEIANARVKETQQKRQMLFPITLVPYDRVKSWKLFDADTGIDSAREIREYFVPDFSNWKDHDSYQQVFEKLVKDLQADPKGKRETTIE